MLYITLDRNNSISLTKQIYEFMRDSILDGTLPQGEKLPSTRELAKYLNVARNIVIQSYEQLTAEGYLYTKNGSGTYVNDGINFEIAADFSIKKEEPILKSHPNENLISFRTGIPDLASIPIKKWGQIYKNITLSIPSGYFDYQNPNGEYELRY